MSEQPMSSEPGKPGEPDLWQPECLIERVAGGYVVRFELLGIKPGDVQLRCHGGRLCVSGVRRRLELRSGERWALEVVWRRFERCVDLPSAVEPARLECDYRNGQLVVIVSAHDNEGHHRLEP